MAVPYAWQRSPDGHVPLDSGLHPILGPPLAKAKSLSTDRTKPGEAGRHPRSENLRLKTGVLNQKGKEVHKIRNAQERGSVDEAGATHGQVSS
jgi:hypothetical protein